MSEGRTEASKAIRFRANSNDRIYRAAAGEGFIRRAKASAPGTISSKPFNGLETAEQGGRVSRQVANLAEIAAAPKVFQLAPRLLQMIIIPLSLVAVLGIAYPLLWRHQHQKAGMLFMLQNTNAPGM